MRDICKSGLMSGEGKWGVAAIAQATAPFFDCTVVLTSRVNSIEQKAAFMSLIIRSVPCYLIASLAVLLTPSAAADYSSVYALEFHGARQTGAFENCEFRRSCIISIKALNLELQIYRSSKEDKQVRVDLLGRAGCCFFEDGKSSTGIDIRKPMQKIVIFEGRARVKNEYVQNTIVGFILLGFSE